METQINYFISTDLVNQIRMTKEFVAHNREKVVDLVTWEDSDLHKEYKQDRYKKWINMIVVDKITANDLAKLHESAIKNDHYLACDNIFNLFKFTEKGKTKYRKGGRLLDFIEEMNFMNSGFMYFVKERDLIKLPKVNLGPADFVSPENELDLFVNSRDIGITTESLDMDSYLIQNGPGVPNIIKKMQMWEIRSN